MLAVAYRTHAVEVFSPPFPLSLPRLRLYFVVLVLSLQCAAARKTNHRVRVVGGPAKNLVLAVPYHISNAVISFCCLLHVASHHPPHYIHNCYMRQCPLLRSSGSKCLWGRRCTGTGPVSIPAGLMDPPPHHYDLAWYLGLTVPQSGKLMKCS